MGAAPHTFRCTKCKVGANTYDFTRYDYNPSAGTNVEKTGRMLKPTGGRGMPSRSYCRYEYRCLDCGHIGASTHVSFGPKLSVEQAFPEEKA